MCMICILPTFRPLIPTCWPNTISMHCYTNHCLGATPSTSTPREPGNRPPLPEFDSWQRHRERKETERRGLFSTKEATRAAGPQVVEVSQFTTHTYTEIWQEYTAIKMLLISSAKQVVKALCIRQTFPCFSHWQISVGIIRANTGSGDLKVQRGTLLPVEVSSNASADTILEVAARKHEALNRRLRCSPYCLLYHDGSSAQRLPDSEKPFDLAAYKKYIGKPYKKLKLFICPIAEFCTRE